MPSPIAIVGMHRSGTSLVSRLLNLAGMSLGDESRLMPPHVTNPRGFWENTDFVSINDHILAAHGGRWAFPPAFTPDWQNAPVLEPIRSAAERLIANMPADVVWGWKDPRTSLTLPFWRALIPDLKVILCVRNPLDVAASLAKRNQITLPVALALWQTYTERALGDSDPQNRIHVRYEPVLDDPAEALREPAKFAGLGDMLDRDALVEATSRNLRHHYHSLQDVMEDRAVPTSIKLLYHGLVTRPADIDTIYAAWSDELAIHDEPRTAVWATLHSFAGQLAAKESQLRDLRLENVRLRSALEKSEGVRRDLEESHGRAAVAREELDALRRHWAEVEGTMAWRAVMGVRRARQAVAPPGSAREEAWHGLLRRVGARPVTTAATQERTYVEWARDAEKMRYQPESVAEQIGTFQYRPVISIVMPVYNTPLDFLREAIDSVRGQYYPNWELCIYDDGSTSPSIRPLLEQYAEPDGRIKILYGNGNAGIATASNAALDMTTGDYVAFLDHDDVLTPDALFQVVSALQIADFDIVYSDEDKLDSEGRRCEPFFKPDWSPALLLGCMYTCHLSVYRRSLLFEVGGLRVGFEGSQDHDLALRATELTQRIAHVPRILYHWRKSPESTSATAAAKPEAHQSGKRAVQAAIERRGIEGAVLDGPSPGTYRVLPSGAGGKVSIIIPTRDRLDLLRRCVESIEERTTYGDYEIIIVDNGSVEPDMREYLATTSHPVVHDDGLFNFARLVNVGAATASGEYLLLLNNDTEVVENDWLNLLVGHAQQPGVGAVGSRLLYPDGSIQHAGVVLGLGGVANHAFARLSPSAYGYYNFPYLTREVSAVTGACLLVRRSLFFEFGGLDEDNLAVTFNDIDFCLRLQSAGYRNVYCANAVLLHHESASRSPHVDTHENQYMLTKWADVIDSDPHYNPSLSRDCPGFEVDLHRPEAAQVIGNLPTRERLSAALHSPAVVSQRLLCPDAGLCGVTFHLAAESGHLNAEFRLRVIDEGADAVLRAVTHRVDGLLDGKLGFVFPAIDGSDGLRLRFDLQFESGDGGRGLRLWLGSGTLPSATVNNNSMGAPLAFDAYAARTRRALATTLIASRT